MPSHHPYRKHLRQQQVHVRSHHDTRPLGVGDDVVQWSDWANPDGGPAGFFYRPLDHADPKRSFREAVPVMLRQAAHFRRKGGYSDARNFLNAARWFRMEAVK